MKTIAQTFQEFLSAIELTKKQQRDASAQHVHLRTQLQQRMSVVSNFLSGSYARKTAVRPLNDIDVFLVLKRQRGFDETIPVATILAEVKRVLDEIYPGKSSLSQNRSVNIGFSGTSIGYDIVPAFSSRLGAYMIPDRERGRWIKTNPKVHATLSTQANERAGQKLKRLIKAIKHANAHQGKVARSFHLEVLSWKILKSDPGSFLEGLVRLLEGLAERVTDPCPDPAGLGPDIQPSPNKCQAAETWLAKRARLAAEAKGLAEGGHLEQAHAKLRKVLGREWC